MKSAKRPAKPRDSRASYRPFPELKITGGRYRVRAWLEAAHEFKYGHRQPLESMLRSRSRPPDFVRELLADYVAGTLKIQSKGACNRKVSLSDRLRVLFFHAMHTPHGEHWTPKTVHEIAAEEGKEPIEIRQRLAKAERDFQTAWAKRLGVSPATIRAIIKPLTAKKK